jgi:hypothetical protein
MLINCAIPHEAQQTVTDFLWTLYAFLSGVGVNVCTAMQTASIATGEVQPEQVSAVMADYVALEHVRVFRQLLVVRCGIIALAIAIAGPILGLLHFFGYWFSIAIFLGAPACVWVVERQRERQLSQRLEEVSGGAAGCGGATAVRTSVP